MRKIGSLWALVFSMTLYSYSAHADSSVQQLVDQTPVNGVLTLKDQTYVGNVVIDKPMTVRGSAGTIIQGDGTGNVITIKAPNVRLEKLTVANSSFDRNSAEEYAGVKVMTDHNVLKDLVITHAYHGVYLSKAHYNEVSNVDITGLKAKEIAGQGNGIMVYYSNHNTIRDNKIVNNRDGIFFDHGDDNQVIHNRVSHTRYGLHYMYSDRNQLIGNSFTANTGGATLMHSIGTELKNNQFALNQGTRAFGLMLQSCDDTTVTNNQFFQNQRALYIDQSQNNRLEKNRIFQNQVGVEIWASSMNQVFTQNQFQHNTAPVITIGGKSPNQWSEQGVGNDWGNDFPLLDLDQNGIGDYPVEYKSSLNKLMEENELVYLFLDSPAIHIYELIGKFLFQQESMFEDPYPIVNKQAISAMPWVFILLAILGGYSLVRGGRKRQ